ncbi:sterol desaturase family protein [Nocardia jinanensis]|uniref:Fatty acid hydroxylase n=1 Tax=Nocardia jinanensis TaxID=382504 RepID=A0A917W093_9NOCA|nr:sterol desaturase family protein [Nocardia jinanensis]GGL46676.1 fatty acid hydroxylase [Nocardia jinanensis]
MNLSHTLRARRARSSAIDSVAYRRLAADEAKAARRAQESLPDVFRSFLHAPSAWVIAGLLVAAATARILVGDWQLTDALVPVLMVAAFPFVEWVIHVCVLHWRPRTLGRWRIDSLLARKHREHHADPRVRELVFIPWQTFLWLLPVLVAVALLAFGRPGLGLTFLTTVGVLGLVYEWTHLLVHTDYQPHNAIVRAVRRNHRLHHFKNEHYWFAVTTAGTADRLLGTYPDPASIPNSPTVKALHNSPAA